MLAAVQRSLLPYLNESAFICASFAVCPHVVNEGLSMCPRLLAVNGWPCAGGEHVERWAGGWAGRGFNKAGNEGYDQLLMGREKCLRYSLVAPQVLCSTHFARAHPLPRLPKVAQATVSHTPLYVRLFGLVA